MKKYNLYRSNVAEIMALLYLILSTLCHNQIFSIICVSMGIWNIIESITFALRGLKENLIEE